MDANMSGRSRKMLKLTMRVQESTDDDASSEGEFASTLPLSSEEEMLASTSHDSDDCAKNDLKKKQPVLHRRQSKRMHKNTANRASSSKRTIPNPLPEIKIERQSPTHTKQEFNSDEEEEEEPIVAADIKCGIFVEDFAPTPIVNGHVPHTWTLPMRNHFRFEYTAAAGLKPHYATTLKNDLSPYACLRTFLDDRLIDEMVDQTNLYATQVLCDAEDVSAASRLHTWMPTNRGEMLKFIGVLGYMGLVKMPAIDKYWSTNLLYKNGIIPKVMTRNRFQILLQMWHFSDNRACPDGDRLFKIRPLLERLVHNFQEIYTPGRTLCVAETVIPFQGRVVIKHVPQTTHKYGIRLVRLCGDGGYTWNVRICAGAGKRKGTNEASIVLNLARDLLHAGRTIVADQNCSSVELADALLDRSTHLIGALRTNSRGIPAEIIEKKLSKGEVFGLENERGVCVLKWRDKHDVLLLSTKHTTSTMNEERRNAATRKPVALIEYNEAQAQIDHAHPMTGYNNALRKSLKWYRKLALELIIVTTVVNANIVFNRVTTKRMKMAEFRETVVRGLLNLDGDETEMVRMAVKRERRPHALLKSEGQFVKVRKYCKGCYRKKMANEISKNKVKKVVTYCGMCENNPHFCLDCFNAYHNG